MQSTGKGVSASAGFSQGLILFRVQAIQVSKRALATDKELAYRRYRIRHTRDSGSNVRDCSGCAAWLPTTKPCADQKLRRPSGRPSCTPASGLSPIENCTTRTWSHAGYSLATGSAECDMGM